MERYIYYMGQRDWTVEDYDHLNTFFLKIFQNRDHDVNIYRIKHMNLYAMEHVTKAILKAVLLQMGIMSDITQQYPNLSKICETPPLPRPFKITQCPTHLFPEYESMNLLL